MADAPALVPVNQTIIVFKDGLPVMTSEPVLTRAHLQSLYFVVAAQPYVVDNPLDPDFGIYDGMTVAEVLVRKQLNKAAKTGDMAEIEKVMDRLIGKSMNRGENVNVNASYEDFLKGVEAKSKPSPIEATIVESEFGDLE